MAITRRKFTLEFRTEAAHRVIDTGRSVRAVASEISVEENTLAKWVRDERRRMERWRHQRRAVECGERSELVRLRREVSELQKDHDFLKKAARTSLRIHQAERFALMDAEYANFEVTRMARLLTCRGPVSIPGERTAS